MPNPSLLEGSGIQPGWEISVDERMRTSAEDVYAAGDLAETRGRLTGETYVHAVFPNAVEQGSVVGLNLPGYDTLYEWADRMNSLKHLGVLIIAVGLKEGDQILRNHRVGRLRTLYLREGCFEFTIGRRYSYGRFTALADELGSQFEEIEGMPA